MDIYFLNRNAYVSNGNFLFVFCSIILMLCNYGFSGTFLVNGNFEEPLLNEWVKEIDPNGYIIRDSIYDWDSDYEMYVYAGSGGSTKLSQTVEIPTTNLEFSVAAKLFAASNSGGGCWGGAAILIAYLSESDSILGETMIAYRSPTCPWTNSPTLHIIDVLDSLWSDYFFNLSEELSNLPGVVPSDIKKIQVALFSTVSSG